MSPSPRPANRLAREKSPYLLQHAHNPVDWYPWGEEAFARARAEDKPIFLSIGYSTCHWCHVMERESFEDEAIAERMNRAFINIKVDREERPDVDQVYMTFVQATTRSGGWPLSVFLTPALEPFFGGTYFPPDNRYGRPGFPALLDHIARTWDERRDALRQSGARIIGELRRGALDAGPTTLLDRGTLHDAFHAFRRDYDQESPGFGEAPKFPRLVGLDFILRWFARSTQDDAAQMVIATLGAIARGGVYDHLGGGVHRYSVDRYWHVPHFEKMLYDQGQLASIAAAVYQIWPHRAVADVARATIEYVLRDLREPTGGAFYSAEDADSLPSAEATDKREGAFYVFTKKEIDEVLGEPTATIFSHQYGVLPDGNAEDPHGELRGQNVLHRFHTVAETARAMERDEADTALVLASARAKLLAYRARRPRPHLDDKVLTAWNGLMIAGLARAYQVFGEAHWLEAAERAAGFVTTRLWDAGARRLWRRWREGEVACEAVLDDYALLVAGLLDLYEASFDLRWLGLAETLTERQIELFLDRDEGGFFATSGTDPSVLVRMKDDYDGAEPSGNSAATMNLIRLGHLLDRADWLKLAGDAVRAFSGRLARAPQALPAMLSAFDMLLESPVQLVIAGERDDPATRALVDAARRRYHPTMITLLADRAAHELLDGRIAHLRGMTPIDGKPAAYVCRDWSCERPTTDPEALARQLGGKLVEADE